MSFFPAAQPRTAQAPQLALNPTLTPAAVNSAAAPTFAVQTFTVNGLDPLAHQYVQVGQFAWNTNTGAQSQTAGISIAAAWVSAANTLSILFLNNTGGNLTPVAGQYSVVAF